MGMSLYHSATGSQSPHCIHALGIGKTGAYMVEALLRLAPGLLTAGAAVPAREAMPLYVRDKVARTTAEREGAA